MTKAKSTESRPGPSGPERNDALIPPKDLAEVYARLAANTTLTRTNRRHMCFALNALSRRIARSLESIPADAKFPEELLARYTASQIGVSPARWRSIKNFTRRAMYVAGVPGCLVRLNPAQSAEWSTAWAHLDNESYRVRLARLRQYCLARDIDPDDINDKIITQFAKWLLEESNLVGPGQIHRATCIWWNHAAENFPNWPQNRLAVPNRRKDLSPWSAFPASLEHDVDAYLERRVRTTWEGDKRRAPLSNGSMFRIKHEIRRFADALVRQGYVAGSLRSLKDIIQPDVVEDGLRFYLNRQPPLQMMYIYVRALELQMIARHWVNADETALRQFERIIKAVRPSNPLDLRPRELRRLRVFDDHRIMKGFLTLPHLLLKEALGNDDGSLRCAKQAQVALGIEILFCYPLWVGALSTLRFNTDAPAPGSTIYTNYLSKPLARTRADLTWELSLPTKSAEMLDIYVRQFRPRLTRQPSAWVFPGAASKPIASNLFSSKISNAIRSRLNIEAPTSLFRHFAAKIILDAEPGAYEAVRQLLGQKHLFFARAKYRTLDSAAVFQRFDARVLKLPTPHIAAQDSDGADNRRDP